MAEIAPQSARADWAGRSATPPRLMAALQNQLPVALIATARNALLTCHSDEELAEVVARNRDGFDYFPVTDAARRNQIVGLIELAPYRHGQPPDGVVRQHMSPLSEDNLIGADAGILTFLRTADSRGCRLVMSGAEISGLISLSDLQQLPVRAALFALVTHIEMTMAEAIRRECGGTEEWMPRMSPERLRRLRCKHDKAEAANTLVDDLLFTEFADKVTILGKNPHFPGSRTEFKRDMADVQALRNNLAHANEYAATREAAAKLCGTVRKIERWLVNLVAWSQRPEQPSGET